MKEDELEPIFASAAELAESLELVSGEWIHYLPTSAGFLYGQPLTVSVATGTDGEEAAPPPSEAELAVVMRILAHLPKVLKTAGSALREARPELKPEDVTDAVEIWLNREVREDRGPNHWSLVLPVEGLESFGVFVDFDDLTVLEVWSGE